MGKKKDTAKQLAAKKKVEKSYITSNSTSSAIAASTREIYGATAGVAAASAIEITNARADTGQVINNLAAVDLSKHAQKEGIFLEEEELFACNLCSVVTSKMPCIL